MVDSIFGKHFAPQSRSRYVCVTALLPDPRLIAPSSHQPSSERGSWSAKSLKSMAEPSMNYGVGSPRRLRGVHDRKHRAAGNTPHESEKFNDILTKIINDLTRTSPSGLAPTGNPWAGGGRVYPSSGADQRTSMRATQGDKGMTEALSAQLDQMREEISTLSSDVDLLNWAKQNIFATSRGPDGEEVFPPVYPHILSHAIKVLRENFNNPHLALALFQHAQSLSLESYLSGCLTGAYNEVMQVRWDSFQDLAGVEQAVREMDVNGVRWDWKTKKIVSRVCQEVMHGVRDDRRVISWGATPERQVAALERRLEQDNEREKFVNRQKRMYKGEMRSLHSGRY